MDWISAILLALGVWVGNWVFAPLLGVAETRRDGFYIGLIAAILVLVFNFILVSFTGLP